MLLDLFLQLTQLCSASGAAGGTCQRLYQLWAIQQSKRVTGFKRCVTVRRTCSQSFLRFCGKREARGAGAVQTARMCTKFVEEYLVQQGGTKGLTSQGGRQSIACMQKDTMILCKWAGVGHKAADTPNYVEMIVCLCRIPPSWSNNDFPCETQEGEGWYGGLRRTNER